MFGTYDRAALQRGFQVYKEVCSACHHLQYVYFRDLAALGYTEDQIKGIAASWPQQVTDGPNDTGADVPAPGAAIGPHSRPVPERPGRARRQ